MPCLNEHYVWFTTQFADARKTNWLQSSDNGNIRNRFFFHSICLACCAKWNIVSDFPFLSENKWFWGHVNLKFLVIVALLVRECASTQTNSWCPSNSTNQKNIRSVSCPTRQSSSTGPDPRFQPKESHTKPYPSAFVVSNKNAKQIKQKELQENVKWLSYNKHTTLRTRSRLRLQTNSKWQKISNWIDKYTKNKPIHIQLNTSCAALLQSFFVYLDAYGKFCRETFKSCFEGGSLARSFFCIRRADLFRNFWPLHFYYWVSPHIPSPKTSVFRVRVLPPPLQAFQSPRGFPLSSILPWTSSPVSKHWRGRDTG